MEHHAVLALLENFSIEITPRGFAALAPLSDYLPIGTDIYITFLPGSEFAATVATARAVKAQGYTPVPHLAARNLKSRTELEQGLAALNDDGIHDLLLLAGGKARATSPYRDSLDLLDDGILEHFHWRSIGFAGHPEGHPDVDGEALLAALRAKQAYAGRHPRRYYLATQFCFTAAPVIAWRQKLLAAGIDFPVRIGIPGVADTAALIRHAKACGVGASLTFLRRNGGLLKRFFGGISAPGKLIADLAHAFVGDDNAPVLHFFPLGGFAPTTAWIAAVRRNAFTFHPKKGICLEK